MGIKLPTGHDEFGESVKSRLDEAQGHAEQAEWHIHRLLNITWGAVTPTPIPIYASQPLMEIQSHLLAAVRLIKAFKPEGAGDGE